MIDIIALCREYHIPYAAEGDSNKSTVGWVQVHCSFCGDGTHGYHLGFSLEHGHMNCWKCGGHSAYNWLLSILPASRKSKVRDILKQFEIKGHSLNSAKVKKVRKRDVKPPRGLGKLEGRHIRYLKSRNFNPEKLESIWGLQGTRHLSANWNWRVVAPIKDEYSRIIAYTGRAVADKAETRWRTTENELMAVEPSSLVYGLDQVTEDAVLIVEGPSDVWRMGPGSVALLGMDWKVPQANRLRAYQRRYIMFDNSKTAQKKAKELAHWLSPFPGDTEIITGIESDPGALSQKEANEIMRELGLSK